MGFSYTKQQQSVIDVRDRNVLVSAAAGSGKTAVLVDRVIQMVLKGQISLDEVLVVTFTRAAASEMRERISEALSKALAEDYRREIKAQLALLPFADITTIHAFCLKVIRENYSVLNLEPDFQIADDSETEILAEESMAELLEEEYESGSPEFLHLARCFSLGTGDEPLEAVIRQVYRAAQGMASPEGWLSFATEQLAAEDAVALAETGLYRLMWQEIEDKLTGLESHLQVLAEYTEDAAYEPFAEQTVFFRQMIAESLGYVSQYDFDGMFHLLRSYQTPDLSRKRKGMDEEILADIKARIQILRDGFEELKVYFKNDLADNLQITANMKRLVQEISRLVNSYSERYQEKKLEKQRIDFNDIEHLALKLLRAPDGAPTDIAQRYRQQYKEIIIDEYQDTNEVQDTILTLVSGAPEKPNSFMVGDIKQSIYKFRQAKPEIFQQKYLTYGSIDSDYAKIDMQMNFRSRQEVLKLVNYIFRSIMTREAAGIDYDDAACFAFAEDKELLEQYRPQILLIEKDSFQDEEESSDRDSLEADAIARKIQAMLEDEILIYDKKMGMERPVQVDDIAILMRSPSSALEIYAETFLAYGIPLFVEEGKAYFMSTEVRTLIDFLKAIDNPRDDMALLDILCSAIYQLEPKDLAEIRIPFKDEEFLYDCILRYVEMTGQDEPVVSFRPETRRKTLRFLEQFTAIKERSYLLSLSELTDLILQECNYFLLVAMQPNGKQRNLNVKVFVEQIRQYEAKEGSGLFHFLQRLDKVTSLNLTFGEPIMEVSKAAHIMSIHKSKGLEFPVVFLAQMGKQFNTRDVVATTVLKDEYGIVLSDIDYENRYIREGFQKPILKSLMRKEILEEEQRLLYVALTRAREYLYMVGTVRKFENAVNKWQDRTTLDKPCRIDGFDGYICKKQYLLSARSYLDFVMPALFRAADYGLVEIIWHSNQMEEPPSAEEISEDSQGVENSPLINEDDMAEGVDIFEQLRSYRSGDAEGYDFYPDYPYPEFIHNKITTSVSEEKKKFRPEESTETVSSSKGTSGAERGSLYHKIFALLPMEIEENQVDDFLAKMVTRKNITQQEREMIDSADIKKWISASLWQRMVKASKAGKLRKEQPFIHAVPLQSGEVTEAKMLQGVIDVFFEEDGQLVLLDYKTDRIGGNSEMVKVELVKRYQYQMSSYRQALEEITGLSVKETYLYSVSRQEAYLVD